MIYNYIIFNGSDGPNSPSSYNEDGYYSICMRDLWEINDVLISNSPLDYANFWVKKVFHGWLKFKLPFSQLWYPFYFRKKFSNNKPLCFVIVGYSWPMEYYKWLRKKNPDAVFVRFTRDLISTQQQFIDDLKSTGVVDYWITYDENEAKKYGMLYHPEVESKISLIEYKEPKYDVFFAGRAKKRLSKIVEVYDKLENAGLNCFFYIMSANSDEQIPRKGIVYSDEYLTYKQMLDYDMQSKCLLEINQEGAVGYTSRFIEAVMYNRKLLTDNVSIMDTPFYNSAYMQCFTEPRMINTDFIKNNQIVDFKYNNEFSPVHFINFLEKLLNKRKLC